MGVPLAAIAFADDLSGEVDLRDDLWVQRRVRRYGIRVGTRRRLNPPPSLTRQ